MIVILGPGVADHSEECRRTLDYLSRLPEVEQAIRIAEAWTCYEQRQ